MTSLIIPHLRDCFDFDTEHSHTVTGTARSLQCHSGVVSGLVVSLPCQITRTSELKRSVLDFSHTRKTKLQGLLKKRNRKEPPLLQCSFDKCCRAWPTHAPRCVRRNCECASECYVWNNTLIHRPNHIVIRTSLTRSFCDAAAATGNKVNTMKDGKSITHIFVVLSAHGCFQQLMEM